MLLHLHASVLYSACSLYTKKVITRYIYVFERHSLMSPNLFLTYTLSFIHFNSIIWNRIGSLLCLLPIQTELHLPVLMSWNVFSNRKYFLSQIPTVLVDHFPLYLLSALMTNMWIVWFPGRLDPHKVGLSASKESKLTVSHSSPHFNNNTSTVLLELQSNRSILIPLIYIFFLFLIRVIYTIAYYQEGLLYKVI